MHYRNSRTEMEALCAELEVVRGNSTCAIQAELADIERLQQLVETCIAHYGRLDGLINNASAFFPTEIEQNDACRNGTNCSPAKRRHRQFFLAQAAAPYLKSAKGSIVSIVDIYAERPLAGHPVYCMAKAALQMMTLALARDLAPDVRVNAIAPGAILGSESGNAYADQQELVARTALKRTGTPEDVAAAVLFLLRDAKFTTGEIFKVDGGRALVI